MIIDYYKFKLDNQLSNNYLLTSATSNSDRLPPERIKFVPVKDKTCAKSRFRLVFDKETTSHIIFPLKNKGLGFFEKGDDLVLVNWFSQLSRIHIMIIKDKKMYAELIFQMFISGLIDFIIKPVNSDSNVQ